MDSVLQAIQVTPGNVADISIAPALAASNRGCARLIADRAYDSDAFIQAMRQQGMETVIRPRRHRKLQREWSRQWCRERNRVERFFANMKHRRRLATRYDKTAVSFVGFLFLHETLRALRAR